VMLSLWFLSWCPNLVNFKGLSHSTAPFCFDSLSLLATFTFLRKVYMIFILVESIPKTHFFLSCIVEHIAKNVCNIYQQYAYRAIFHLTWLLMTNFPIMFSPCWWCIIDLGYYLGSIKMTACFTAKRVSISK